MRSNCLIFALCKWWSGGGYLCVRMSRVKPRSRWMRWVKWPHFLWAKSLDGIPVMHLQPMFPQTGWRLLFHPLLFRGFVRGCDKEKCSYATQRKECRFCYDDKDDAR